MISRYTKFFNDVYRQNEFCFILDWLWQDYILYNHYKTKFLKRVEVFGRVRMDIEKQKMRNVLSRAVSECDMPTNATTTDVRHFCDYYQKDEFLMIDEVRDIQRKRSLDIISKLKPESTKQR